MRVRATLLALALAGIAWAQAAYQVGQKVWWRDDSAGHWVKATVLQDYGPAALERFVIQIDGRQGQEHARLGMLKPADGSPRPPVTDPDPYRVQQMYGFHPERDNWPLPQEKPQQPQQTQVPAATTQPAATPINTAPTAPMPAAAAAPLGKGMYPNGEKMGIPGQTNYRIGRDGQEHIVTVATPGDESFLGRWRLKAGGSWSASETTNLGHGKYQVTETYNFPADADVLVINANGTWFKQFAGKRSQGRWLDLGSNVVQLVGFEADDWTGSVSKGELTIRGPVGTWEYGRRF